MAGKETIAKKAPNVNEQVKTLETKLRIESSLRELQNKVHSADLDAIVLEVKDDVKRLLSCERVTIYVKDPAKAEIVSKVKDGQEIKEIRLPIDASSIAGYIAFSQKPLRLINAYDPAEWAGIDLKLKFNRDWDKQSGFTTKQILGVPVMKDGKVFGVIQALNTKDGGPFSDENEKLITDFAVTLAIAFANKQKMAVRASAYDSLLRSEVITQEVYDKATMMSQKEGNSVEHILLTKFEVPIVSIGQSLKDYYRCEFVPYQAGTFAPVDLLPKFTVDYLKHHLVVPLGKDNETGRITVLMANPRSLNDRDDLQRRLGVSSMNVKVAIREHILEYIDDFYGLKKEQKEIKQVALDKIISNIERKEAEADDSKEPEKGEEDASIISLCNQVIDQAYTKGASDIHIEPVLEGPVIIRFRVDGACFEHARLPGSYGRAISSRFKIMSNLDIAERRLPQDGKIRFREFGSRDIELRVATLPTSGGMEDIVMRILAASKPRKLTELKILPEVLNPLKKVVDAPYGIFLCVGPTGSGKTTTLHSALGSINNPDVKIWTAEDPVEITQPGLRQVQVQSKIGLTFERCLRAFLRADPDIIMVGEMRDLETAGAAIEASLTGHMVFSTLHTNSAPETITRLLDLGLDPYAFGDSLLGILAQRLLRSLCSDCKEKVECTKEDYATLKAEFDNDAAWEKVAPPREKVEYYKAKGCDKCNKSGYRGRLGIHELLVSDDNIRLMIYRKAKSMEIRDDAIKKGMFTLKQDGIRKVMMGWTDLKEVRSVASK